MPKTYINKASIRLLKKRTMEAKAVESVNLDSACHRLREAIAELEDVFVNRTEEIAALTLAIACGQHLLLEGKPGVAKSDMAREAFRRITGCKVYDKMFNKGTSHDDVFGPTLVEKYKAGVWEHNIEGALPCAHFANLEELSRASDVLLPSMMTVLNERLFHNGNTLVNCPLVSAIATVNFLNEEDELAAFNDRWLVHMVVKPLANIQQRASMISRSVSERPMPTKFISLAEIKAINYAVQRIQPDEECVALYVDLAQQYQTAARIEYISDRRLVASFKLAKARAVLAGHAKVTPDDLEVVRYGLSIVGKDDETIFSSCLQRVVGDVAALKEETAKAKGLYRYATKMRDSYDPAMAITEARKLHKECGEIINSFKQYNKPIRSPENSTKMNEAISILESLKDSVEEIIRDVAITS